ncbi:MAG: Dps family protein [Gammaproteobacteria bacterium]
MATNNKELDLMNQAEALVFGDQPERIFDIGTDVHVSTKRFLSSLIADTYRLSVNTVGIHWNITGPLFNAVREITREQSGEMLNAVDEIAERLRALGGTVPQKFDELPSLSALDDPDARAEVGVQIEQLAQSHEALAEAIKDKLALMQYGQKDPKTTAVLTERIGAHDKHAWMLRALTS